jgi:hypothetical protein
MQKTPAFQWCCREERSTPEKCAGHIAEFEKNFTPESHVQGPRSCASFYLGTKGVRVTSILWNVSRRVRSPRRGFRVSLCLLRCPTPLLLSAQHTYNPPAIMVRSSPKGQARSNTPMSLSMRTLGKLSTSHQVWCACNPQES